MPERLVIEHAAHLAGLSRGQLQHLVLSGAILGEERSDPRFWRINRESLWNHIEKLERASKPPISTPSHDETELETASKLSAAAAISSRLPLEPILRLEALLIRQSEIALTPEETDELDRLRASLEEIVRTIWERQQGGTAT